jgi:dTDP-4-dehydrorhamnose reductase
MRRLGIGPTTSTAIDMTTHKILVLGASGMLGNAMLRYFVTSTAHHTMGTVRSERSLAGLPAPVREHVVTDCDVEDPDALVRALDRVRPDVVINCVGVVKQLEDSRNPLAAIPINSILPHRLAQMCSLINARLIHLSTDCVFDGSRGGYREEDLPDATDLYGRTKLLGELHYPHTFTIRTSIIGHELGGNRSLVDWFLSQTETVGGFSRAIFSGFPTVEIARIIDDFILPRPDLSGVYHVSAAPIDKYRLLRLVGDVYGKDIAVEDDPSLVIDRSLDSSRFRDATGFRPDDWPTLVRRMHAFH